MIDAFASPEQRFAISVPLNALFTAVTYSNDNLPAADGRPLAAIRYRLKEFLGLSFDPELQRRACKCLRRYLPGPRIPHTPETALFSKMHNHTKKWAMDTNASQDGISVVGKILLLLESPSTNAAVKEEAVRSLAALVDDDPDMAHQLIKTFNAFHLVFSGLEAIIDEAPTSLKVAYIYTLGVFCDSVPQLVDESILPSDMDTFVKIINGVWPLVAPVEPVHFVLAANGMHVLGKLLPFIPATSMHGQCRDVLIPRLLEYLERAETSVGTDGLESFEVATWFLLSTVLSLNNNALLMDSLVEAGPAALAATPAPPRLKALITRTLYHASDSPHGAGFVVHLLDLCVSHNVQFTEVESHSGLSRLGVIPTGTSGSLCDFVLCFLPALLNVSLLPNDEVQTSSVAVIKALVAQKQGAREFVR